MLTSRARLAAMAALTSLVTLPSWTEAKVATGMDLCSSFAHVCVDLTSQMDCRSQFDGVPPKNMIAMASCQSHSYDTYVGQCLCSGLDAGGQVLSALVDYSVDDALPHLLVPGTGATTNFGPTFQQACNTFLTGSKCPAALQVVKGFSFTSPNTFKGECSCGTVDASDLVKDAVIGYLTSRKLATNAVSTGVMPAEVKLNLCQTFKNVCSTFLDDIGCTTGAVNSGCSNDLDPNSLVGTCKCGSLDASSRIKSEIVEYTVKENLEKNKVFAESTIQIDMCNTYTNVCNDFLDKTNVSTSNFVSESNCNGQGSKNLATFKPSCASSAGTLDVSSAITDIILERSVKDDIATLVCLGNECAGVGMNIGIFAIIIISAVLAGIGLITFAYQRGDAWAHALVSNPLVNRIMSPFFNLCRRGSYNAKSSPAVTNQQVNLRGSMA